MITRVDFAAIDLEIRTAIQNSLDNIRISNHGDYALFLADGDYQKEYERTQLNPYVIDSRIDRCLDESRLDPTLTLKIIHLRHPKRFTPRVVPCIL